jgi:hypothetical protein
VSPGDDGSVLDHHCADRETTFIVRLFRLNERFAHEALVCDVICQTFHELDLVNYSVGIM